MNKDKAVHEFVKRDFVTIPRDLIFRDGTEWWEEFEFTAKDRSGEADEDYVLADLPMWGYVFLARDGRSLHMIDEKREEVMDIGFTIIEDVEDNAYIMLGIDSCGHNFYDAYWEPLYDLFGYEWHDED